MKEKEKRGIEASKLLYLGTHKACRNYGDTFGERLMEHITLKKGESIMVLTTNARLFFVLTGRLAVHYGNVSEIVEKEKMLFFPPASHVKLEAKEESGLFICRLAQEIELCDEFSLVDLHKEIGTTKENNKINALVFNDVIRHYLEGVVRSYDDGLRCVVYQNLKLREVFFLLRGYYSKETLHKFFLPVLSNDSEFTHQVWMNYRKAGSVAELADMMNYSESHFHSKFRDILGVSALQWLNTQKARNIYFDLKMTNKSFAEISEEYHFASTSYLSTFCKRNFDLTPKEIRETC